MCCKIEGRQFQSQFAREKLVAVVITPSPVRSAIMACVELEVLKAGEELTAAKTREPLLRNISVKQQSQQPQLAPGMQWAIGGSRFAPPPREPFATYKSTRPSPDVEARHA